MSEGRRFLPGETYRIVALHADGRRSLRLARLELPEAERIRGELLENDVFRDVVIEPDNIAFVGPPAARQDIPSE